MPAATLGGSVVPDMTDPLRVPASPAAPFRRFVEGAALPPYVPGEPRGLAARMAAALVAPGLLRAVARSRGVTFWTWARFRREFLMGAYAAWRPGTEVQERGRELRVTSPTCPLLAAARLDPRACEFCRSALEAAARRAVPGEIEDMAWDRLIARGDDECAVRIRRRGPVEPPLELAVAGVGP